MQRVQCKMITSDGRNTIGVRVDHRSRRASRSADPHAGPGRAGRSRAAAERRLPPAHRVPRRGGLRYRRRGRTARGRHSLARSGDAHRPRRPRQGRTPRPGRPGGRAAGRPHRHRGMAGAGAAGGAPGPPRLAGRLAGGRTGHAAARPRARPVPQATPVPRTSVRAELAGATTLAIATRTPLHRRQLGQIRQLADKLGARVLVLTLLGEGHHDVARTRGAERAP